MKKISSIALTLLLIMIATIAPTVKAGGKVSIDAKLDSMVILMGKTTVLRYQIVQDKGVIGKFANVMTPVAGENEVFTIAPNVEVSNINNDTTDIDNNRIQIVRTMTVQSFDSGVWQIPELKYAVGADTFRSKSLSLKVIPVPIDTLETINEYKDVADVDFHLMDYIPDFIYNYWWIYLLALILICAIIYLLYRRKKGLPIIPRKPVILAPPYEEAVSALEQLQKEGLWQQGLDREYYTRLTDILRRYIYRRFQINAVEMTSSEIINTLRKNEETKAVNEQLKMILDVADFVKFANVRSIPEDSEASLRRARNFVDETRPVVKPEDEAGENKQTNLNDKKSK